MELDPGLVHRLITGARRPLVLLDGALRPLESNAAAARLVDLADPVRVFGLSVEEQGPRDVHVEHAGTRRVLRGTLTPFERCWLLEFEDVTAAHDKDQQGQRLRRQLEALSELTRVTALLEEGFAPFAGRACEVIAHALEIDSVDLWLLDVDSEVFEEQGLEMRHAASSGGQAHGRRIRATLHPAQTARQRDNHAKEPTLEDPQ